MEKSFGDVKENIRKVLKEPERAFFYVKSIMNNLKEFECKVILITCYGNKIATFMSWNVYIAIWNFLAHFSMD